MDIGEGLANFGSSIGGALEKRAKLKKEFEQSDKIGKILEDSEDPIVQKMGGAMREGKMTISDAVDLIKAQGLSRASGVYATDPITGELTQSGTVPKGSKVYKKALSPEQMQERGMAGIDVKAKQAQATELAKGVPTGQMGMYTLAGESENEIEDVKKALFPDGTPASFRRDIAMSSTMPVPLDEEGQKIKRKMITSIAGRQLIQTGVAARPDETKALHRAFMANIVSNPEAAYEALNQLQNFYRSYRTNLETRGTQNESYKQSTQQSKTKDAPQGKSFKNLWE